MFTKRKLKYSSLIILVFAIVLGIALFADAYFFERYAVRVEHIDISSPKLSHGLRLVHLSDLHLTKLGEYERKVIRMVNEQNPDVIVITGDFFSHAGFLERPRPDELKSRLDVISSFVLSLRAQYGVIIVRGNNDFSDDKEVSNLFLDRMREIGVPILSDTLRTLLLHGQKIAFLGVDFPEYGKDQAADFWVNIESENHLLQSFKSERNSYSHYFVLDHSAWRNYTFTGRMRFAETEHGAIGVTFYSQMDHGYDRFYRLRCYRGQPSFHFSPHGTQLSGGVTDTGVVPQPEHWYNFKIHISTLKDRTEMRAKVWEETANEPDSWQANAYDDSATRLKSGTVGVWSAKKGVHQFDDLVVVASNGDTLMAEDFEQTAHGHDPPKWVDFNRSNEAIHLLAEAIPDSCYSILLSHTPDYVKEAQKAGVDLVLSGHTHGGQIRLPIIGPPIKRIALGRKYMQGLHRFGDTFLYVNRGIGTIHLPLRFLCPPEIAVINLLPAGSVSH